MGIHLHQTSFLRLVAFGTIGSHLLRIRPREPMIGGIP
jgi:hypothetical protein